MGDPVFPEAGGYQLFSAFALVVATLCIAAVGARLLVRREMPFVLIPAWVIGISALSCSALALIYRTDALAVLALVLVGFAMMIGSPLFVIWLIRDPDVFDRLVDSDKDH